MQTSPFSLERAGDEWRIAHGGKPLLAIEAPSLPEEARGLVEWQFRRHGDAVRWRLAAGREAAKALFGKSRGQASPCAGGGLPATVSWRHPAGADATARDGGAFARAPVLSSSAIPLPALFRNPHGRFSLLAGPPGARATRMTGLGRDGAPRWALTLPLRPSRGGGASTPWLWLLADSDPRALMAAAAARAGELGRSAAEAVLGFPTPSGAAAAAFWRDPAACPDDPAFAALLRRPADEERWLRCDPGEYATVARRSGDLWIVAALNGPRPRVHTLLLDFLPEGAAFDMDGTADDQSDAPVPPDPSVLPPPGTPWTRHDKTSLLLARGGGYAVILVPHA